MESTVNAFFSGEPRLLPLFEVFKSAVNDMIPGYTAVVQKSQIAFRSGQTFCAVWLPIRTGIKGRPEHYFIVTFGLDRLIDSPRITDPVEPYPNRWTHHVIISKETDIDAELMGWIKDAHRFKNTQQA